MTLKVSASFDKNPKIWILIPKKNIGPETYDKASDYILTRFTSLNQCDSKQIYTHFTCATDTEQIKFVMAAVNDIIIQNNLRDVGLL
jgi:guanine nucleotide-binding protein subunit alpha